MSDIPIEKKLQLVRQVRSQYHQNQYDLQSREQILYGKSSVSLENKESDILAEDYAAPTHRPGRLRLLGAAVLFLALLLWDLSGQSFWGYTTVQLFEQLARDYEVENFLETDSNP